ncbi:calpain-7-like [Bradysia coprophila]|uniref:calpain-7-like n=1 Tax=Bradysia coprophila TaxID=38358 RepID=UPI00187DAC2F|nr:calpain-7-like [Bradysia coprophila]XP_037044702.1 calpain-7-like [Bradysia coprophila]
MLTDEEKEILAHTSCDNSRIFLPFTDDDTLDRYTVPGKFTDKDGFLELSPLQSKHSVKWQRIDEICKNKKPKIVYGEHVDWNSVRQSVVGDCSFLSSLVVAAHYEKRFAKPLITSTIYPRNIDNIPVYNPCGQYAIKLHMNGIERKIVIDDYLPVSQYNQLLCAHSSNQSEFWVSLLEKAYMKLMGGYNFPGSDGGRDLHALTGWIPELIQVQDDDPNFNTNNLFDQLKTAINDGRCLITVITSTEISEEEVKRSGLVARHAYAVLDMREIDGVKLLQLKNPWSQTRWKGNYSEYDIVHWTKKLQQLLDYDPKQATRVDNGVFWMDYHSLLYYFRTFSVNWNPALFQFTDVIHEKWSPGNGIVAQTIGDSPQYSLTVGSGTGSVWILLTTHVTCSEDICQKREFLRLLVYLNNGRKVIFPRDYFTDEKRINNQHFLAKLRLDANQAKKYTLVVSQFSKIATNYYTMRIYCGTSFELKPLAREYFANVKKLSHNMRNFLHF